MPSRTKKDKSRNAMNSIPKRILAVKRIENKGRFGEYPALQNTTTGKVYVDITLGLPRFLTVDAAGRNIHGEFVGYNLPGAWNTWNGQEPECPLKHDCQFELTKRTA